MKSTIAAGATLLTLAAAIPQGPPGPHGRPPGGFGAFPSCVSSCWSNVHSSGDYCAANTISSANSCIASSSCSDSEKSDTYKAVAQLCANAGTSVTAAPEATWSATSGKWSTTRGAWGHGFSGRPGGGWNGHSGNAPWPTGSSEWSVFTSWTAAESITGWPTASSEWAAFTSAHPVPTGLNSMASWWSANGFPGGSAWPTAWTTNSAWSSVVSQWGGFPGGPGGPGGWNGAGGWGPFGHGGQGHGWGPWASQSSGAWTNGPWTSWWGTDACPASTWSGEYITLSHPQNHDTNRDSGWTNGPWGTNAPWTTWSGCTASTTATSVVTNTLTANGTTVTTTKTQFGIQVAQATNGGGNGAAASSSTSPGAAMATNFKMAGSAAGMVGVVAGALLL